MCVYFSRIRLHSWGLAWLWLYHFFFSCCSQGLLHDKLLVTSPKASANDVVIDCECCRVCGFGKAVCGLKGKGRERESEKETGGVEKERARQQWNGL